MSSTEPARLSHDRILGAAHALVERDGLEALSMRRLAQSLDVWPMSLYRYFHDKDELLDALAASALGDIRPPSADAPWRRQMHQLLGEVRIALASEAGRHLPRAFLTPGVLRLPEAGLAILEQAGLSREDAVEGWRALWSYTFGFATFTLGSSPDDVGRRARSALAAQSDEEYPALTRAADEFAAALASNDQFERGLDLLLDGLSTPSRDRDERRAARKRKPA
jgi:AcrR family transcriptional regulator